MSRNMSSTNKGNYKQCENCIFKLEDKIKYPCSKGHRQVRKSGNVKYEREFSICGLFKSKS